MNLDSCFHRKSWIPAPCLKPAGTSFGNDKNGTTRTFYEAIKDLQLYHHQHSFGMTVSINCSQNFWISLGLLRISISDLKSCIDYEICLALFFSKCHIMGASCKTLESKRKSSFRASEARPGIQYFRAILDSGFRRNDGVSDFCKKLMDN